MFYDDDDGIVPTLVAVFVVIIVVWVLALVVVNISECPSEAKPVEVREW